LTDARAFLDAPGMSHYGPIFDALQPFMPDIIGSYSPLVTLTISSDVAEYGLKRTIDGQDRLFLVDFLRGGDGVWRLDSMWVAERTCGSWSI
jgi:hypothetical protein